MPDVDPTVMVEIPLFALPDDLVLLHLRQFDGDPMTIGRLKDYLANGWRVYDADCNYVGYPHTKCFCNYVNCPEG